MRNLCMCILFWKKEGLKLDGIDKRRRVSEIQNYWNCKNIYDNDSNFEFFYLYCHWIKIYRIYLSSTIFVYLYSFKNYLKTGLRKLYRLKNIYSIFKKVLSV